MEYKHSNITGEVIAASLEVHKELGNGFQEVIYQRALSIEMKLRDMSFSREFEMPIQYKTYDIGTRRVDFFVSGVVSVEIKAVIKLDDTNLAQALNYLEAYNLEVGLLINFGAKSLEVKRLYNSKYKPGMKSGRTV